MALQPLLVFVVLSGQLYPLSLDSESDSEPNELEREREGGGGHGISPLSTSSHEGVGGRKKSFIIRGAIKNIILRKNDVRYFFLPPRKNPHSPLNP